MILVVLGTIGAVIILIGLILVFLSRSDTGRIALAFRIFHRILGDPKLAAKLERLLAPEEPKSEKPLRPSGMPLRMLALLQREARLVDFLMEDIKEVTDQQIVVAARDIHEKGRAVLKKRLVLSPVIPQSEGTTVEVPAGFDPSAIQLVGNVTGQPPFRGVVRHSGWKVEQINIPPLPEGQDDLILMPAEVALP
ncbi:MAG TPA: DUF2760 domain-containing protein [Gemmataceae bacterium]|nr:DUF2760 domain-containing protein [Gemmataceae bacterium]